MNLEAGGFIRSVTLLRDRVPSFDEYPYSIPAVRHLDTLELEPAVTFVVGENGSGKSTLVEAIAVAAGLNAEGGTSGFNFTTRSSHSELHDALWSRRVPSSSSRSTPPSSSAIRAPRSTR